jgi:2-polyprenyl-3-methyl-5-hydroxy-6-metoxy-1,4-benzoquinol methylase
MQKHKFRYTDKSLDNSSIVKDMNDLRKTMWEGIHPKNILNSEAENVLKKKMDEVSRSFINIEKDQLKIEGLKILDLGAGQGDFVIAGLQLGLDIYGLEPELSLVSLAKRRLEINGLSSSRIVSGVGEKTPFANCEYDFIASFSVLEHVQDVNKVIKECFRILKPDGIFYLGFPNYLRFRETHYKMFFIPYMPKGLAKLYFNLRGRDGEFIYSINYINPKMIIKILNHEGFDVIQSPIDILHDQVQLKINNPKNIHFWYNRIIARILRYSGLCYVLYFLIRKGFLVSNNYIIAKKHK